MWNVGNGNGEQGPRGEYGNVPQLYFNCKGDLQAAAFPTPVAIQKDEKKSRWFPFYASKLLFMSICTAHGAAFSDVANEFLTGNEPNGALKKLQTPNYLI